MYCTLEYRADHRSEGKVRADSTGPQRRWEPVFWCDEDQEWEPWYDRPPKTDAEVLAEMPTHELVFEVVRRFELGEYLTSPELYRFLQRIQAVMSKEAADG